MLMTASLSSNTYNNDLMLKNRAFGGAQSLLSSNSWVVLIVCYFSGCCYCMVCIEFSPALRFNTSILCSTNSVLVFLAWVNLKKVTKILLQHCCEKKQTASAVPPRNWHQTSKYAQYTSRSSLWVRQVSCELRVLEYTQLENHLLLSHHDSAVSSVMWCMQLICLSNPVSHAIILFCDRRCQMIRCPQDSRSSNTSMLQAFQCNLKPCFWQLANCFSIFWHDLMITNTRCGDFVWFIHWSVRKFAINFSTCLSMTSYVVAPSYSSLLSGFMKLNVCVGIEKFRKQLLYLQHNSFVDLSFALGASKIYLIKKWFWVFQVSHVLHYVQHVWHLFVLSRHFDIVHENWKEQTVLAVKIKKNILIQILLRNKFQQKLFKCSFP